MRVQISKFEEHGYGITGVRKTLLLVTGKSNLGTQQTGSKPGEGTGGNQYSTVLP
jgi:hypothetical protein